MDVLAPVFLSLSTNADNFAVGAAYGVKKLSISFPANLLIACLSGASTFISMSVGERFALNSHFSHVFGSGLLIFIGLLSVGKALREALCNNSNISIDYSSERPLFAADLVSNAISLRSAFLLGTLLTISNIGTGVGAGMAQVDVALTSGLSFLSSLLTIGSGFRLGRFVTQLLPQRIELFAGILLICLGLYEYFF